MALELEAIQAFIFFGVKWALVLFWFLSSFLLGAVEFLSQCLMCVLGPLRVDGRVKFLRQIPAVAAII